MIGVIYKITSPTGRIYIGQTKNYTERLRVYRILQCKNQVKLYNSLKKYGFENHIFEIVESNIESEFINQLESKYINDYNCVEKGLNSSYTAGAFFSGRKHSEDTKLKMSIKRRSMKYGPKSSEHRKNMSLARLKGYKNGSIVPPNLGRKLSKEVRDKISLSHIGKIASEATKRKISKSLRGKRHSSFSIQKMIANCSTRTTSINTAKKIKYFLKENLSVRDIVKETGIHRSIIYNIKYGTSFAYL